MIENFLKPKFNKIVSSENSKNKNIGVFTIEKLERGFGNTIGVAMRRTLLSSIPGAAIFAIKIDGVSHEFSPIKDVKEDAVELILNIKKIILEINEKAINEQTVFQMKLNSKSGVVKAKDIVCSPEIKISNPDLVLATTSKDNALNVTFYVAYSKGFKNFEENRNLIKELLGDQKGVISIDSNFSSINKVEIKIEEVNPGETRVFERLILTVETNGSLSPSKAVAFAGAILKHNYMAFENMFEVNVDDKFVEEKQEVIVDSQLQQTIDSLNLSVRSENALKLAGIKTVEELISLSTSELKKIENLGEKSITEIFEIVKDMGLAFKSE